MPDEEQEFTAEDKQAVAEAEFERFADAWELDTEIGTMPEEDAESFKTQKRKVLAMIKRDRAVVNEGGDIVYQLKRPVGRLKEITLETGAGASYWGMDKARGEKYIGKLNHYICDAVGIANSELLKMSSIDTKFLYGVYGLFLNS